VAHDLLEQLGEHHSSRKVAENPPALRRSAPTRDGTARRAPDTSWRTAMMVLSSFVRAATSSRRQLSF
jgi:hypothetical protein